MMKKINLSKLTALIMVTVILLQLLPLSTYAESPYLDGGTNSYFYDVLGDGTAKIVAFSGGTDIVIPNQVDGLTVTSIGMHAFNSKGLTSVVIPNTVTSIGNSAFSSNQLTSVTLSSTLQTIGDSAFSGNSLTSVTIPDSVTSIGEMAFAFNQLSSATLSSSLQTIGMNAFAGNELTSITIPATVTDIGMNAFMDQQDLGVKTLTTVTFDAGSSLLTIGDSAFAYNAITNVTLPTSLTTIGNTAFSSNQLSSIIIPANVTSIGNNAFDFQSNISDAWDKTLKSIEFAPGSSLQTIGNYAFANNAITSLTLPTVLTTIGKNAFENNKISGSITIPDSVTSLKEYAFNNNQITSVTWPSSITSIEQYLFTNNSLTDVTIPATVTSIGDAAFSNQKGSSNNRTLTSVNFAPLSQLQTIGVNVFGNNAISSSVTIPATVTSIGDDAFCNQKDNSGNATLTTLSFGAGSQLQTIGNQAFVSNAISSLTIPDTVTTIGEKAFFSNQLTSLSIPSNVTTIGTSAFEYNFITGHLTIPDNVTSIGYYAFKSNQLTGVTIPAHLTDNKISAGCFYDNLITDITIPTYITKIEATAFAKNNLTSLTIPDSVTTIDQQAFNQNDLTNIVFSKNLTSIGNNAFYSNNQLASVTIPESVTSIGSYAFAGCKLDNVTILNASATIGSLAFAYQSLTPPAKTTINGHAGSTAQTFANADPTYLIFQPLATTPVVPVISADQAVKQGGTLSITPISDMTGLKLQISNDGTSFTDLTYTQGDSSVTLPGTLLEGTYNVYTIQTTSPNSRSAASTGSFTVDNTAPALSSGTVARTSDTAATVTFNTDGAGQYYYALVDSGASAPVINISGSGTICSLGQISITDLTGLTAGAKDLYIQVKDTAGNISNALMIQISAYDNSTTEITPENNSTSVVPATETTPKNNSTSVVTATETTSLDGNGTATTKVTLDETKLDAILNTITNSESSLNQGAPEGTQTTILQIQVSAPSDIVNVELSGQAVQNMEDKNVALEITTNFASYTVPASQFDIAAVSEQVGQDVKLKDLNIQINIAKADEDTANLVKDSASKDNLTEVVSPVDFNISASYRDKSVHISEFKNYVERTVTIPKGVDSQKITTGVIVDPNGDVRHVPTQVTIINGEYFAKINSLTNSTYSVIWNSIEFKDAENHWAKDSINDMGSRLIISGTGNNMFAPDRDITRAEFAAIIVRALGLKPGSGNTPFTDVNATDWYSGYIITAAEYEIIDGYGDGKFAPNDKITREQAMTMATRAMNLTGLEVELVTGEVDRLLSEFNDSDKAAAYAKNSIATCVKSGIVSGKNENMVEPKANITRAEVAVIIQKLLHKSNLI